MLDKGFTLRFLFNSSLVLWGKSKNKNLSKNTLSDKIIELQTF